MDLSFNRWNRNFMYWLFYVVNKTSTFLQPYAFPHSPTIYIYTWIVYIYINYHLHYYDYVNIVHYWTSGREFHPGSKIEGRGNGGKEAYDSGLVFWKFSSQNISEPSVWHLNSLHWPLNSWCYALPFLLICFGEISAHGKGDAFA